MAMAGAAGNWDVDVVIPVYNGGRFLAEAVRSVLEQTVLPARVIIADDGSTDHTPSVAASLVELSPRVKYLALPHKGVSAARNAAISVSNAAFVAFLDADDVWMPNKLEKQMEVFAGADPDVGFVHSSYFYIDEFGRNVPAMPIIPPAARGDIFLPLLFENYVLSGSASSVVVRREVLDRAGYFDERLFHGEDWDLWLRLAAISHADYSPEQLVAIRIRSDSAQRSRNADRALSFFEQHLLIFAKWPEHVAARRDFVTLMRRNALLNLLPWAGNIKKINKFYYALSRHDSPLARSLFKSRADLWLALGGMLGRYGIWRLRRHLLNDRRRFLG